MASGPAGAQAIVVVGVDGSTSSLLALDWAVDYAVLSGAALEIVAAWDWPRSYGWAGPLPEGYNPADDAVRMLSECEERARERQAAVPTSTSSTQGNAAEVLVQASRSATLLVVGSRGHGQFAGILLGSVSEHCVGHAHCPVLVYRAPPDK